MKRRILTLLLTLVMVLSLLPGTALAVNGSSSAPAVTYADRGEHQRFFAAHPPTAQGANDRSGRSARTAAVDGHDRAAARLVPG